MRDTRPGQRSYVARSHESVSGRSVFKRDMFLGLTRGWERHA